VIFTKRSDYGLRAVLELAGHYSRGPLSAREIAERGGLPEPFVKKLLQRLASAEIVQALRGRYGGYVLTCSPEEISLLEILQVFEDLAPVSCLQHPVLERSVGTPIPEAEVAEPAPCSAEVIERACPVRVAWEMVDCRVRETLRSLTLADLLREVQSHGFLTGEEVFES
jgi:Rrf2 family protein